MSNKKNVKMLSGADLILKVLENQGVEVIFGYPGGAVLPIYDAIFGQNFLKHVLIDCCMSIETYNNFYKNLKENFLSNSVCATSRRIFFLKSIVVNSDSRISKGRSVAKCPELLQVIYIFLISSNTSFAWSFTLTLDHILCIFPFELIK